jgi:hypothetical protein
MAVLLPVDQLLERWPDEFRGARLIPNWSIPREFLSAEMERCFNYVRSSGRSTAIAARPRTT